MPEGLLTAKEAAKRMGVHVNTVKRLPIPFTRVGRDRRYHPAVIDKYLRDHSNRPAEWPADTAA